MDCENGQHGARILGIDDEWRCCCCGKILGERLQCTQRLSENLPPLSKKEWISEEASSKVGE